MAIKLKPCPFCGGAAQFFEERIFIMGNASLIGVKCTKCGGAYMTSDKDKCPNVRPEWCPLLPLPKGHGRLGDLDALLESMRESYQKAQEWRDNSSGEIYDRADATVMAFLEFGNRTKNAPTIVPAEGGTDNGF